MFVDLRLHANVFRGEFSRPMETLAVEGPQNIYTVSRGTQSVSILLFTKCQKRRKVGFYRLC